MAPAVPYILVAIAAAAAGAGADQSRKAAHAEADSQRAQANLARIDNIRKKQEQLRQERLARADILAGGEAAGATGSSGVTGGVSGAESTAAGNISFLNTVQATQDYVTEKNIFAAQRNANANLFASIPAVISAGASIYNSNFAGTTPGTAGEIGPNEAGVPRVSFSPPTYKPPS